VTEDKTNSLEDGTETEKSILKYRGVNLAGGAFGSDSLPGEYRQDYIYPNEPTIRYFLKKGMKTIRLPFRWERLQRSLYSEFDSTELQRLRERVEMITDRGGRVVLDPHNYARYQYEFIGTEDVPEDAFVDFWLRLSTAFRDNERVIFGLMNEPYDISAEEWLRPANEALQAIRNNDAEHLVLVPGVNWASAGSWADDSEGSNADVLTGIEDSADNYAVEVHVYFDEDDSGTSSDVVSPTIGIERMTDFVEWCREHGIRGFVGEFGAPATDAGDEVLRETLSYMEEDADDVFLGWTYWAAGQWWPDDYIFGIQPDDPTDLSTEARQLTVISEFLSNPDGVAVTATGETISSDETATLLLDAESVETVTVQDLWTDWQVSADEPAGSAVDNRVDDTGELELDWDAVQTLAGPSLTVIVPDDTYVGGTYAIEVLAEGDGEPATDTALLEIQSGDSTEMADSVSQYGITWEFETERPVGQYANGDYWVEGPVTITEITPSFDVDHHGWESNPNHIHKQGFDTRIKGFDPERVPEVPYEATGGESIVKTVSVDFSKENPRPAIEKAAVLTVVDAAPPRGGSEQFRPPYFGTDKPRYATAQLHPEKLPRKSVGDLENAVSLDWVEDSFERVWLDHKKDWTGRPLHPKQSMPEYGSEIGRATGEGALRLLLDDPIDEKRQALINYVQVGLDLYHMLKGGQTWPANGGHGLGRKLPIAFAGVLLDEDMIVDAVRDPEFDTFQEDASIYYSPNAETVLWGQPGNEDTYWLRICEGEGAKSVRDPYGYIDGGRKPGVSYQFCCNSMTWKATALGLQSMPELRRAWNDESFLEYVDRWVNFGTWAQPDPYALDCDDPGSKDGEGRFPDEHGVKADSGNYQSDFANELWEKVRPKNAAGMPAIEPYDASFEAGMEITLRSSPRTPDCELYYTLDGSEPTTDDLRYDGPFTLSEPSTVRVRAYKDGCYPSAINSVTFEQGQ